MTSDLRETIARHAEIRAAAERVVWAWDRPIDGNWFSGVVAAIPSLRAVLDKGEPRKMMVGHYPKRAGVDTVALADLDEGEQGDG